MLAAEGKVWRAREGCGPLWARAMLGSPMLCPMFCPTQPFQSAVSPSCHVESETDRLKHQPHGLYMGRTVCIV